MLIGGDMAYDIVTWLIDHSPYEAAQFFYTYGDKKELEDVLALAKKKDFGTIAMKTMGGVGRASTDKKFLTLLAALLSPAHCGHELRECLPLRGQAVVQVVKYHRSVCRSRRRLHDRFWMKEGGLK